MMPDKTLTDAVEAEVDRRLLQFRNRKGSWWKLLAASAALVALGYVAGNLWPMA